MVVIHALSVEKAVFGCQNHRTLRWLRYHPKYARAKAKPIEVTRKLAQEPEALRGWYTKLENFIDKLSIQPEDLYNMDETGCRIGVAKNQYSYTSSQRQVFIPHANNRELITIVEAVSSVGEAIPPMIIIKAATIMEYWAVDLPDDHLLYTTDSGYSNGAAALHWLKHFDKMTQKRQRGAWRLLLIDGHGSLNTRVFCKYAEENSVQLFALPPHTTHILQPLDVGCFQPLKWYHGRTLDYAARAGSREVSKADFLATVDEIRRLTFPPATIRSGWRRTGIAPFKPEVVLSQLRCYEDCNPSDEDQSPTSPPATAGCSQTPIILSSPPNLDSSLSRLPLRRFHRVKIDLERAQLVRQPPAPDMTPEPENPRPDEAAWHTPKTVRQIQLQEPLVNAVLKEHLPSGVAVSVIRHIRGISALARICEGLKRELRRAKAAENAKVERCRRKKCRLEIKGGPIYSQDARAMVQQREVNELARLEVDLIAKKLREATKIANKWKKLLPTIRNHGSKCRKRAANGVILQRSVARWQKATDDDNIYNTRAAYKWEWIAQLRDSKYQDRGITEDSTPAYAVAGENRRLVDTYLKVVASQQNNNSKPATALAQKPRSNTGTVIEEASPFLYQDISLDVNNGVNIADEEVESDDFEGSYSDADTSTFEADNVEPDWVCN